jgi:chromosome segregation ATPase
MDHTRLTVVASAVPTLLLRLEALNKELLDRELRPAAEPRAESSDDRRPSDEHVLLELEERVQRLETKNDRLEARLSRKRRQLRRTREELDEVRGTIGDQVALLQAGLEREAADAVERARREADAALAHSAQAAAEALTDAARDAAALRADAAADSERANATLAEARRQLQALAEHAGSLPSVLTAMLDALGTNGDGGRDDGSRSNA